jgi:outer membrane protein assembly factor BamB
MIGCVESKTGNPVVETGSQVIESGSQVTQSAYPKAKTAQPTANTGAKDSQQTKAGSPATKPNSPSAVIGDESSIENETDTTNETVTADELEFQVAVAVNPSLKGKYDPTRALLDEIAKMQVGKLDWPQWAGWTGRNNTPQGKNIPAVWDIEDGTNIKWTAKLGSQTYGNAVVANGKIYVGTNNGAGNLKRYPKTVDLGCLVCFDEKTGKFLWQHSSQKLPTGRVHDWPYQGICDAPYVDGDRLWFVGSRGEVICLDTEGFLDGENDGPFKEEDNENKDEADVVWKVDMMRQLGTSQHNTASCSVTCAGDILFVNTSNGVDFEHLYVPAPDAPSFMAMDRNTGKVLWTDKSPGKNFLHGQWSSPTYAVVGGQPQVLFAGGDGWIYSFDPQGDGDGNSKLLWKFDCNPKQSKWILSSRGTRNNIIATPVVYDGLVFCAVGQDPEHGQGIGHLWCINPTKRGDVSPELAVDGNGKPIPHKRIQAVDSEAGEKAIPNPNSAAIWHYSKWGEDFLQEMHRTMGTVAIKDDILYIADFTGLFHCLNAKTGKSYWTYDMFAAAWGTPLIVDGKVYIGDEDGDVAIFTHSSDPKLAMKMVDGEPKPFYGEMLMQGTVYSTPIVANNVLYITNQSTLFAITVGGK